MADKIQGLSFIFTEDGFYIDTRGTREEERDGWFSRFENDRFEALYQLGFEEKFKDMTPTGEYMYYLAAEFLKSLTALSELELLREEVKPEPSEGQLEELLASVPFAVGAEHINKDWILNIFDGLRAVFSREIKSYNGTAAMYLAEKSQKLRVPERIFFHLVEQKDEAYPFAFLATYATKSEDGGVRHMPLKYALTEYKDNKEKLLALLSCLNRASEVSPLISGFVESGEMFHPLRLTAEEAYAFLKDTEAIENSGIMCRIPNWWKKKYMVPSVTVNLGEESPSLLGFDTLISLTPRLTAEGEVLSEADIRLLLAQTEGLALLKGKWVEVDHKKLRELLKQMEELPNSITLMQALRSEINGDKISADVGTAVTNGKWLSELFSRLRNPKKMEPAVIPLDFHAVLRPYQEDGYTWLDYMGRLGFGACLADDMGLGKTVQVLAYLEHIRENNKDAKVLLIVPASLLGNWQKETEKFAPEMDFLVLHGKTAPTLSKYFDESSAFLTITTYGMAARIKGLKETKWDLIILDEAQAIKNPTAKQTRTIKEISSKGKIAMTGTPIENNLTNLWSLFDFLNKGLLGTSTEFKAYCKGLNDNPQGYQRLKTMISPFMLRRLKTDKSVIADLPEKVETVDYAELSKKQIVLYRKTVADMEYKIKLLESEGIERRGVILGTIMKLKQICNHPDQFLGQSGFSPDESGKLQLLREICETIYEKRERVIVFTQFKEITEPLAEFLSGVFGCKGCILHGGTPVKKRAEIVEAFQGEKYIPFMVISVKAGGTGLNLTKANHVVHFDRWWNPAVENQATDRAFRIGQKKNVIVHKFVCKGTIEEKIDEIINSKTELAENVIGSGSEKWITELSDRELMSMLRLETDKRRGAK